MDTQAYLLKHGWRGAGHSLDTSDKGLRKPLLISKKVDVLGVGIKKHDVIADQWWMKAFDSSLRDFGTGKKSLLAGVREHGVSRGGLYARFVQGESEGGTIGTEGAGRKRKADEEGVAAVGGAPEGVKKVKVGKTKTKTKSKSKSKSKTSPSSADTSSAEARANEGKKDKTPEALSEDRRRRYAARAAAKGLTLEDYVSRRAVKNLEARSSRRRSPVSDAAAATNDTEPPRRKAGEKDKDKGKDKDKDTAVSEEDSSARSGKKDEQRRALADKILHSARRKLTGETADGEATGALPDVPVTSETGPFTAAEWDSATRAAKRVIKGEKQRKGKKA